MRRVGYLAFAVPFAFLLAGACSSSGGGGGSGLPCGDGGVCPSGQQCVLGACVLNGTGGSGGNGFGGSGFGGTGGSGFGGNGGSAFGGTGGSGFGGSGFGGNGGSGFGGTGGSGFGGNGGSGFGGSSGSGTGLGRACATSAECGGGLFCATANSGLFDGGGPAKGLCTLECTSDSTLCAAYSPNAVCIEYASGKGYCVEGCSFGPPTLQQFSPTKCHGRQEVACSPLYADTSSPCSGGQCPFGQICGTTNTCLEVIPACLPQCNSNQDCGGGLYCDPSDGSCKATITTGKPVGATCTQNLDAGVDECKGDCIGFVHDGSGSPFTYMCAEQCTLGASPSCDWAGPSSGVPAPAACLFVSTVILNNGGSGVGDVGSCGQLCDCNSDCLNSALVCEPFDNPQIESFYQKSGYCSDPLQTDGGLSPGIACP